ncbi:MAG: ATP-binding cassette domain-containing protein [Vulcanimicrobiota bacterium]
MIDIQNLFAQAGEFRLKEINLSLEESEYFVILGPTGGGKTVLAECIMGLQKISQGKVYMENKDITNILPEERGIGYLPQEYCLFPHLNVTENIEFGMRIHKVSIDAIKKRVEELSKLLKIESIMKRTILHLSGGEKQRVSLARALAMKPKAIVLDEPLSALDESLRSFLAAELKKIQRKTGATFVHICHNFDEAMDVADRVAIMDGGQIIQVGTLQEIFRNPRNLFVARFMKTDNIFQGYAEKDGKRSVLKIGEVSFVSSRLAEGPVCVGIRPERIHVSKNGIDTNLKNHLKGTVTRMIDRGPFARLEVDTGINFIVYSTARELTRMDISEGDKINLYFNENDLCVFQEDPETLEYACCPECQLPRP